MRLNIAHKIFAISAIVLILMVAVAIYSIKLTESISSDLHGIANKHLPVSMAVSRINVMILEQGIVFQRQLVTLEEGGGAETLRREQSRFRLLHKQVSSEFEHARKLLSAGARSSRVEAADNVLLEHLGIIERSYHKFEQEGSNLSHGFQQEENEAFDNLDRQLNEHQNRLDQDISQLRVRLTKLADSAVEHADQDEKKLLWLSLLLTTLAVILAVCFAYIVTRLLVRSVRNLVAGTESVEAGDYESKVEVTSDDEIGKLTVAFNSMVDGLRMKERIKDTFGKYMDPRIVSNLLDSPDFSHSHRREMSVIFIDLKGFTSISELLPADDLVGMVNDFFTHMSEAISLHHGVVDKYMGDAVMAYWGPPFCREDEHAALACRAALEALEKLDQFRGEVATKLGEQGRNLEIDLRIGISTGEMIVGNIGSRAAKNYTVMGNPVNLGSRLEGANKAYGTHILISDRTRELLPDTFHAREVDIIRVKGKQEPSRVHELCCNPRQLEDFSSGLLAYRQQNWDRARVIFLKNDTDPVSQAYLQRIEQLQTLSLPDDWDGVWNFESK